MQWLNEPSSWQRTGDEITVNVDPGTDFWRETGYGYIRDSGHVYGEVLGGDLDVSARVRGTFAAQYDQAGLMLRVDDRVWLKTGMEFFEGRARLSTVLTLGRSSWMVTDLPEGTDEISIRASRRGDAVEVRYLVGEGPAELAALVFLPPGREVLAGVMCAAPEGPGFGVKFTDLRIDDQEWREGEGEAAPGWAVPDAEDDAVWDGQPSQDGTAWDERAYRDGAAWERQPPEQDAPGPAWNGRPAADSASSWAFTTAGGTGCGWAQGSAGDQDAEPRWPGGQAEGEPLAGPETLPGLETLPGPEAPAAPEPSPPPVDEASTAHTPAGEPSDPVADWERLAAVAKATPWQREPAADLGDRWPGPPLTEPAAGGGPPRNGRAGHDRPAAATSPADAAGADDVRADVPGDKAEVPLADDRTEPELPAAVVPPPASGRDRGGMPKRPPIDLAPPADPADEWISLLTADD